MSPRDFVSWLSGFRIGIGRTQMPNEEQWSLICENLERTEGGEFGAIAAGARYHYMASPGIVDDPRQQGQMIGGRPITTSP